MNAGAQNDRPPAGGAAEGRSIAIGANALSTYRGIGASDKGVVSTSEAIGRETGHPASFRSLAGVVWRYRGKRARVLAMLATSRTGLTQWDTLPWHTRLGGTIHALREDGLSIETVREGEYRHARYWLRTPGKLDEGGSA